MTLEYNYKCKSLQIMQYLNILSTLADYIVNQWVVIALSGDV